MGRDLQRTSPWWLIALLPLFILTESRLVHSGSNSPRGRFGKIPAEVFAAKQQQTAAQSVPPAPIVVKCDADAMEVVVQADMFNTGLEVDGRRLRLGSDSHVEESACGAFPSGDSEFTIKAQLVDCGTQLSSTEEKIIYSNVLVYSPEPSSEGLLRLDGAAVPVECHYAKKYAVEGISLHPTWLPYVSKTAVEDQIDFNLRLMNDHWHSERGSYTYFLGDPIHFEASVIMANHMPLRVYVDQCVATATPDAEATLRYDFIENYGCLTDAYLTNSSSRFLPRIEEHKLRFKIDAFRFYKETSNQVYITCYMKAVPVALMVSSHNRACSLIEKRWRSVDGNDEACRSCDIPYRVEEPLSTEPPKPTKLTKGSTKTSQESLLQASPESVQYIRFHPGTHQSQSNKHHQSSVRLMKRGAGYTAKRTIQLGPLIVLAPSEFVSRPTDSKTIVSPMNNVT